MFNDIPLPEAVALAEKMPYHSLLSFQEPISQPITNTVDLSYVMCTEDKCLSVSMQKERIKLLSETVGKDIDVRKIVAGHCANVSKPDELAEIVRQILEAQF